MKRKAPCIEWADKLALKRADLSPSERIALEEHLKSCETCSVAEMDYHFMEQQMLNMHVPQREVLPLLAVEEIVSEENVEENEYVGQTRKPLYIGRKQIEEESAPWLKIGRIGAVLLVASLLLAFFVLFHSMRGSLQTGGVPFIYDGHRGSSVNAVAWSRDSTHLVSIGDDETVQIWAVGSDHALLTHQGKSLFMQAVSWSPDGKYIASTGSGNTPISNSIEIWIAGTGAKIATLSGNESSDIKALAWSPNGNYLASADSNGVVLIWDIRDNKRPIATYTGYTASVNGIAWSPDGKYIATASSDHTMRILKAIPQPSIGNDVIFTDPEPSPVMAVAWSPKGEYIALAEADGTVKVWDTNNNHVVTNINEHKNVIIHAITWSPDGRRIAAGYDDGQLWVWDAFDAHNNAIYKGHKDSINAVAWSPDGKYIASASKDGTVRVWAVDN